jgi:hypothetical protein
MADGWPVGGQNRKKESAKHMKRVLKPTSYQTKKAADKVGLNHHVQINIQKKLRTLKGKIHWEGDLEAMRKDFADDHH